jgi:hypothetical protein
MPAEHPTAVTYNSRTTLVATPVKPAGPVEFGYG